MNAVPINHRAHTQRQIYSFHSLISYFTVQYFRSAVQFHCLSALTFKFQTQVSSLHFHLTSCLALSVCLPLFLSILKWLHFIFGYSKENILLPELPL